MDTAKAACFSRWKRRTKRSLWRFITGCVGCCWRSPKQRHTLFRSSFYFSLHFSFHCLLSALSIRWINAFCLACCFRNAAQKHFANRNLFWICVVARPQNIASFLIHIFSLCLAAVMLVSCKLFRSLTPSVTNNSCHFLCFVAVFAVFIPCSGNASGIASFAIGLRIINEDGSLLKGFFNSPDDCLSWFSFFIRLMSIWEGLCSAQANTPNLCSFHSFDYWSLN